MKFRIHFESYRGEEDYIDIEAPTIEEVRRIADIEIERLGGKNPWSEEIKS